jgi:predicted nucleic acid-binding protein
MSKRAVLDTNVFIYAFEFPESNSATIIELVNDGELEPVITKRVLIEVVNYFRTYHGKELAGEFRHYLLEVCTLIFGEDLQKELKQNRGTIGDKDAEQLAAAQHLQLPLVAYDRDFNAFHEYKTPSQFVQLMGKEAAHTPY